MNNFNHISLQVNALLIFICCLGSMKVNAQDAPIRYELKGKVLSVSDSLPIPSAHIYEPGFNKFTVANFAGDFSIMVEIGDTIIVSSIGFKTHHTMVVSAPGPNTLIYLAEATYELPGLTIYGKNYMEGFYDHDRLYYPQRERSFKEKFPGAGLGGGYSPNGGAAGYGLITLLAYQFNSAYKQSKKLEKIRPIDEAIIERQNLIQQRLTPEFLAKNTSLQVEEVEAFLKFWEPDLYTLRNTNEYELLEVVRIKIRAYSNKIRVESNRTRDEGVTTIELRGLLDNFDSNKAKNPDRLVENRPGN